MTDTQAPLIEAEADDYDSGLESASLASSTTSIASTIFKYRSEHGRTYHAYKDGAYAFPNDDTELDRLDLQHHQFSVTFDGKLFLASIPAEKILHRVVDVGTGTGIWAIDFADMYPQSQVLGVDLSPVQPGFVPQNLSFQIDDIEEPWTYGQKFDFIYSRMMVGSLANVPRFFEQSFENLAPGGVLEMADIAYPAKLNGGDIPEDSQLYKWSIFFTEACAKAGRNANCARLYKTQMETAGFTNVVEKTLIWPTNRWPKDKKMKDIGMWTLENLENGLEALSTALFTRVLGWEKEELDAFLVGVRKEMRDTKFHTYWDIIVVFGTKPE